MTVSFVEYRNKTAETVHLILGDRKEAVGPYDSVLFSAAEAEIADLKYGDVLERVQTEGLGTALKERRADEPIWLANMSGNPDAPEWIEGEPRKNKMTGLYEPYKVLNMLAKPRDYSIWRRPVPVRTKIEGATIDLKPAKQKHTIRYGECRPVEPKLAAAFLRSAVGLGLGSKGWIIEGRNPDQFHKPDNSWSYDEVTLWVGFVNHEFDTSKFPTEAEIRKSARSGPEAERMLFKAKKEMLKRVYFLVVDPRYEIPTRSEWEAYYGKADLKELEPAQDVETREAIVAAQTAPVKQKKRGRPRKNPAPASA